MFKSLQTLSIITAVIFLISACSGNKAENDSSSSESASPSTSEMAKAPNFEVTTIEGEEVSLQSTLDEGKPMVVYFTASWCPVCAKNWPALSEVYPEYKDRLDLVAIGIDPTDDKEVMTNLAEEEGFTFPVTPGNPDIMVDFGVQSQATTVGINRDGQIVFQKNKTALSADEYRALFDQLLN